MSQIHQWWQEMPADAKGRPDYVCFQWCFRFLGQENFPQPLKPKQYTLAEENEKNLMLYLRLY